MNDTIGKNEMTVVDDKPEDMLSQNQSQKYYSIEPKTRKEAVQIYNAVNNPDERVADFINKEIKVVHVLIENVEITDKITGEINICHRTVFIDDKGKSYVAVSFGIFNSTKRMVQMFGEPTTWETPVIVEVKQISKGTFNVLTLNIKG